MNIRISILLSLLLLLIGAPAVAGPQGRSLDEAVSEVRQRNKGKVLSADTVQNGDRSVHRIRMLNKGRVRGYRIDAATGKPLPRPKPRSKPRPQRR